MNFKEYQKKAKTFCLYNKKVLAQCLELGLMEESGEIAGVIKKNYRDNKGKKDKKFKNKLLKELGDLTWYIALSLDYMKIKDELISQQRELVIKDEKTLPVDEIGIVRTLNLTTVSYLADNNKEDDIFTTIDLVEALYLIEKLAKLYGYTISDVYETNIAKLTKRKKEGKIHGEGSDR